MTTSEQNHRLPGRGVVDRDSPLTFEFDGRTVHGFRGDTLASALLANGIHQVTTSITRGRPRGVVGAGAEDPTAVLQIDTPFPEPMQQATLVELAPGIRAHGIPGQGRLADLPDPARYDTAHLHVDVLVVGAGPSGLVAAWTAVRSGARVALVDDQPRAGLSLAGETRLIDGVDAARWADRVTGELVNHPGHDVTHLQRTTVFGTYDDNLALAVERRTDHLGSAAEPDALRQRIWRIRATRIILATGAHERPVAFRDNDRPGVLLASAAGTYLHRYGVRVGDEVVIFTTNDSAYAVAVDLHDAGTRIAAVIDSRPAVTDRWTDAMRHRGIPVIPDSAVTGTEYHDGSARISGVCHGHLTDDGNGGRTVTGAEHTIPADTLLVSGGWNPSVHLYSQAGGTLHYDRDLSSFIPGTALPTVTVTGAAAGHLGLAGAVHHAWTVARGILGEPALPRPGEDIPEVSGADVDHTTGDELWYVPTGSPSELDRHFVDLQRDVTVADIARAVGAGLRSMEHIKRFTTIGTAHDQGKTSGIIASGIASALTGTDIADTGTTRFRPPYTPVAFAALAGRARGHLYDPARVTCVHDWHVGHGAVFEDVGQWKRPRYYPAPGEDMEAAVRRETVAVRTAVGMLDGTTLGKIDVQGPDAAVFLDRIYTNMMSSLKVGSIRYGAMCGVDGMIIDDGTVLRIAEDRYLVYTTTGGAAPVLDWMEEWLQTEWPDLRVYLTSVTEQWVTFPVPGPLSRAVVGDLFPDVDVSAEAFPFMTWQDTELDGVPVRLARVSFSGELAFEISTCSWYGLSLWTRIFEAGRPYGITPYGTEAMHVLRAEKGYPIIGQDTDGTVTPHDLGMSWVVSKKKDDFIGKRSFSRVANLDPHRRQFVGLLPRDGSLLPEGTQLVAVDGTASRMEGFVTSSYDSAALGTTFALALVRGGHHRHGETLHAVVDDRAVPVTVTGHVLFDPEGTRRDG